MSNIFRDLRVYKIALDLVGEVEQLTSFLSKNEYRQIDQIRRASRSIVANIAEGYGKRHYDGELLRYLSNALGSSDEVQAHLDIFLMLPQINKSLCFDLQKKFKNLSVRLLNFIQFIKQNQ